MSACLNTRVSEVWRRPVHLVVPVCARIVQCPLRVQKDDRTCGRELCSVDARSEGIPAGRSHGHGVALLRWQLLYTSSFVQHFDVSPRRAIELVLVRLHGRGCSV